MKFLKFIFAVCFALNSSLVMQDFLSASNDLSCLTKEELQVQSKIIAKQILSELNPDAISKIKKHGFYALCAAISGLCVASIVWGCGSGAFSDLEDSGVNACLV